MKTETTSAAAETTPAKQAWTEPTLTILAVSLETCFNINNGGDGSLPGINMT